jgi:hypothetical protein
MEFNNKQEILDVLNDLTPTEAINMLPHVKEQYATRVANTRKAEAEAARLQAVCEDNDGILKFLATGHQELIAKQDKLRTDLRQELYALRADFAVEGQTARVRKLADAVAYFDAELDFFVYVKRGADEIFHLDSLELLALSNALEVHSAALLSHVSTVAALGPAYEGEGSLGVIGVRTERLRSEAAILDKRYEAAKEAARSARAAYERQQAARVSRGIITSSNVSR